jgi:FdhD protein
MMPVKAITHLPIVRVDCNEELETNDTLAVEEPLEIRLEYGAVNNRKVQNISVTMRTPGNDAELASGFLFTEGIIKQKTDIKAINEHPVNDTEAEGNIIQISLAENIRPNLTGTERNFYTSSSCGVCGKTSIGAISTLSPFDNDISTDKISAGLLYQLPLVLQQHQGVFAQTGGIHASALFDLSGEMLLLREDVGRHNALDKLIGAALDRDMLPLNRQILLLSGRISFELVQKAAMAGINIIAAVGAPSSLAVKLAQQFKITLVGFLRNERFNIYTQSERITLETYEDSYQG